MCGEDKRQCGNEEMSFGCTGAAGAENGTKREEKPENREIDYFDRFVPVSYAYFIENYIESPPPRPPPPNCYNIIFESLQGDKLCK